MPLLQLALTVRRHPRAWRLLAGVVVMIMLFTMLLSAVEPAQGAKFRAYHHRNRTAGPCAKAQDVQARLAVDHRHGSDFAGKSVTCIASTISLRRLECPDHGWKSFSFVR